MTQKRKPSSNSDPRQEAAEAFSKAEERLSKRGVKIGKDFPSDVQETLSESQGWHVSFGSKALQSSRPPRQRESLAPGSVPPEKSLSDAGQEAKLQAEAFVKALPRNDSGSKKSKPS